MKEKNELDKLLRASLDPYKSVPDPSRKRKFLEEASPIVQQRHFLFSGWRLYLMVTLLVIFTGIILYHLVHKGDSSISGIEVPSRENGPVTPSAERDVSKLIAADSQIIEIEEVIPDAKTQSEIDLKATGVKESHGSIAKSIDEFTQTGDQKIYTDDPITKAIKAPAVQKPETVDFNFNIITREDEIAGNQNQEQDTIDDETVSAVVIPEDAVTEPGDSTGLIPAPIGPGEKDTMRTR